LAYFLTSGQKLFSGYIYLKPRMMNKKIFTPILTVCAILLSIGIAHADETLSPIPNISDQWRFEVTPYAWLPTIGSTLSYNDRYVTTASLDANKVLSSLKSGAMIAGEAHYGNWGGNGGFHYCNPAKIRHHSHYHSARFAGNSCR
jgi:hypothetical protein